jgi:hypothetical protein
VVVTTMKGQTGWGRAAKGWDAAAATRVAMVARRRSWGMLLYRRVKVAGLGGRKGRGALCPGAKVVDYVNSGGGREAVPAACPAQWT